MIRAAAFLGAVYLGASVLLKAFAGMAAPETAAQKAQTPVDQTGVGASLNKGSSK